MVAEKSFYVTGTSPSPTQIFHRRSVSHKHLSHDLTQVLRMQSDSGSHELLVLLRHLITAFPSLPR